MNIQSNAVLRQNENIVVRKVMDEVLLVPITGELASMDEVYALNETGAFIWNAINGERSLAEIGKMLVQEYDALPKDIESDVLNIVGQLVSAGLLSDCEHSESL